MFHLTLSPKILNIFEGFCILKRCGEVECLFSFPSNYSFQKFYEFIFPCNCPKEKSEEYCIVISNANNDRSFLLCRYSDANELYLCIYSYNPWFEIFSKLLLNLCHNDFMPDKFDAISSYLNQMVDMNEETQISLPACSANDNITQRILKNSMIYPYIYDKYIQEYLTAIKQSSGYNKQLWLEIFWSMLLERPIIFMSKRYQKLTSSLLAATFFIHPLSWLYKFVSIIPQKNPQLLGMNCCMLGIHSCMEPIISKTDFWNEALLVDLDKGDSRMVGASENEKETHSRFKVPKIIRNFFINRIQQVDESVSSNIPLKIKDLISNTPWHINKEETMYNEYKKGFHIYPLLFRTIISMLIGNYRQFICLQDHKYEFEREKFIQSNSKLTEFLKIFVQSQCFDSFIEEKLKCIKNGQDMNDRFDRERQELTPKVKGTNTKPMDIPFFNNKPFIGSHLKSNEPSDRLEKTFTMPAKKTRNKLKEKISKAKFHAKSLSLSSSASSINGTNHFSPDNMSNNSESLDDHGLRSRLDKPSSKDRFRPIHLSKISGDPNDVQLTPTCERPNRMDSKSDDDFFSKKHQQAFPKPSRPQFKPGETPAGRVTNIVNQINLGNLEGNIANNRKKSSSQIKSSELPPTTNPVSKLASMFETKAPY